MSFRPDRSASQRNWVPETEIPSTHDENRPRAVRQNVGGLAAEEQSADSASATLEHYNATAFETPDVSKIAVAAIDWECVGH